MLLDWDASPPKIQLRKDCEVECAVKRAEQSTMLCGKREGGERGRMWTMMVMVLRKMLSNGSAERDLAELCVCLSWAIRVSERVAVPFQRKSSQCSVGKFMHSLRRAPLSSFPFKKVVKDAGSWSLL